MASRVMRDAGFEEITFAHITPVLECPIDEVIGFLEQGTVRMTMVLRAQTLKAHRRIEQEIRDRLSEHAEAGMLRLPMPAIVASGALR